MSMIKYHHGLVCIGINVSVGINVFVGINVSFLQVNPVQRVIPVKLLSVQLVCFSLSYSILQRRMILYCSILSEY